MQTNPLSDDPSRKKRERMPKVSFVRDIRPLFRAIDISHMKSYGVKLDDFTYMSNPDHANKVLRTLWLLLALTFRVQQMSHCVLEQREGE
jgi:hypothetical protein